MIRKVISLVLISWIWSVTMQGQVIGITPDTKIWNEKAVTLAQVLLQYLDNKEGLPVSCSPEEIIKAIKQHYNLDQSDVTETITHLQDLNSMVKSNQMSITDMLRDLTNCKERCGKILNAVAGCYILGMKDYFQGFVFFNIGRYSVDLSFSGDKTHGEQFIDNSATLNRILHLVKNDPNLKMVLEARASLIGNPDGNEILTFNRVASVQNWFAAKGISNDRIQTIYLGEFGPYINESTLEAFRVKALYDKYSNASSNRDANGNVVVDGLNQTVTIYLIPKDKVKL
jgi:outer membrane protein OmpA-like peptidoglycan-associated protein